MVGFLTNVTQVLYILHTCYILHIYYIIVQITQKCKKMSTPNYGMYRKNNHIVFPCRGLQNYEIISIAQD